MFIDEDGSESSSFARPHLMRGSHVAYVYQMGCRNQRWREQVGCQDDKCGLAVDGGVGWLSGWKEHADVNGEEEFLVMESLRLVVSI